MIGASNGHNMRNGAGSELSSSNGSFADKNPTTFTDGFSSGKEPVSIQK